LRGNEENNIVLGLSNECSGGLNLVDLKDYLGTQRTVEL